VFLHEGLGSVSTWTSRRSPQTAPVSFPAEVADALGWGALIYSRRGYGKSSPIPLPRPIRYMHDEAAGDLPAVLAATGVRRAVLVGHSDGGSISLLYAGSPSPSIELLGLVLLAPHVICEPISVESIRNARVAYETTELREKLERHHGDNTEVAFRGWNDVWLHPDFLDWNIEDVLPNITTPTLVIQGNDDVYGTLKQVDSIERGVRGPFERLILPDCGHSPQRDQPDATREAILRFAHSLSR
jgi:pimeloyl-ACP methyl ester carboxylesterase